jgi:hypothetical protein
MTQDERASFRQRERTQPGGYAAPATDASSGDPALVEPAATTPHGSPRIIKPRLGSYRMLREAKHRQELVALNRRDTPRKWLFDPTAVVDVEAIESSPPALTVDAPRLGSPTAAPNDTRRLPPRARLVRALRSGAALAALALLLVAAVAWSLNDGEKPRAARAPAARTPAAAAPPVVARAHAAATAPKPAAPALERTAPEAVAEAKPPEEDKPQAVSQSAAPIKPKAANRDDAASPFGKWTVPPRD